MGKSRFASLLFRTLLPPILATGQAMAHHEPPGREEVDEFAGEPFTAAFTHPLSGVDHWLAALVVGLIVWSWGRKTGIQAARLPAHRPDWPRWAGGSLAAAGTWLLLAGMPS